MQTYRVWDFAHTIYTTIHRLGLTSISFDLACCRAIKAHPSLRRVTNPNLSVHCTSGSFQLANIHTLHVSYYIWIPSNYIFIISINFLYTVRSIPNGYHRTYDRCHSIKVGLYPVKHDAFHRASTSYY